MIEAILIGLGGLMAGTQYLFTQGLPNVIMFCAGGILLYLAIKKGVEPLLLVPIGFGCILVNLPLSELMEEGGVLRIFYEMGIMNELFPLLIFVGIGAMTDFGPLLENPKIFLLGAAGWGPSQLEEEITSGAWMTSDVAMDLIFSTPADQMWEAAFHALGIDPAMLVECDGIH